MEHTLPSLPYDKSALKPFLSERAVEIHYEKHHRGYMKKLNKALEDTPEYDKLSLEELICQAPLNGKVFNSASQLWNHTFFWRSVRPEVDKSFAEKSVLARKIDQEFGSLDTMFDQFIRAGMSQFGSGWVWLVQERSGKLEVCSTSNAESVLRDNKQPLLVCDVWEHAYYIDYQNDREAYLKAFIKHINWDFVEDNLER